MLIVILMHNLHIYPVEAEFKLMCGNDATDKITTKWNEIVQSLLRLGSVEVPDVEKDHFEAIKIIDKKVCPTGPLAKSPVAFFLYEIQKYV